MNTVLSAIVFLPLIGALLVGFVGTSLRYQDLFRQLSPAARQALAVADRERL